MIFLDLLYKICYSPFHKLEGGRSAALAWTTQIIGFILLAIINAIFFFVGIDLPSIAIAIVGGLSALISYYFFNRIYVIEKRDIGVVKFPFLMGILIFILLMASLFLMIVSLAKY